MKLESSTFHVHITVSCLGGCLPMGTRGMGMGGHTCDTNMEQALLLCEITTEAWVKFNTPTMVHFTYILDSLRNIQIG